MGEHDERRGVGTKTPIERERADRARTDEVPVGTTVRPRGASLGEGPGVRRSSTDAPRGRDEREEREELDESEGLPGAGPKMENV